MLSRGAIQGFVALAVLACAAVASCGDDDATETPPATGGSGGSGGSGGAGNTDCSDCGPEAPICVDDDHCAAACPDGRAACQLSEDASAPDGCCPPSTQCCPGGSTGPELCRPLTQPCPTVCPDGETVCEYTELCSEAPADGTWSCVTSCQIERNCDGICCPLGSRCEAGQCELADITVATATVTGSVQMQRVTFDPGACEIVEGCIGGPGERTLLRFSLETPNIGAGDLFMGDPTLSSDVFEFSSCHGHYHFNGYASYRLLDMNDVEVATGHKQAFCLLDLAQGPNGDPQPQYDCDYQGISAGWADIYDASLPCQWVDVTGVPPGNYQLEIVLNGDHTLAESDYDNNLAVVGVTIAADTCPNGCKPFDAMCCTDADPCGWANDGSCDCFGTTTPEAADCANCWGGDPDCGAGQCNGCSPFDPMSGCCEQTDNCNWANDGWCDCDNLVPWDMNDCILCTGICN